MIRIVELSNLATVALDIAAWGLIHAGTGYLAHRLDACRFDHDTWLTRGRRWERDGRSYERLRIRAWKDRLPEAGAVFAGGVSKRQIGDRSDAGLHRFATETRRAEFGHWACAALSPVFVLWNPPAVAVVMVGYGLAVNLPFIVIQRYNRLRLARVVVRRSRISTDRADGADRSRSDRGSSGNSIP